MTNGPSGSPPAGADRGAVFGAATLLPIMAVVFVAFLVIGMAMPVLPLHVHHDLGFGTFVVGLVAGGQFAASLLSRFWSGTYADTRGAKRAMVVGLLLGVASGLVYFLSLAFLGTPEVSVSILLAGRALLGGAESFIITGALAWGLGLGGARNTGRVIAWVGTALWAAYAAGAPAGTALFAAYGFPAIALATLLLPLLTLFLVAPLRPLAPAASAGARPALREVVRAVALPGLGLALSSVGFGAITTFGALLFAQRGWGGTWIAFTALSVFFLIGRVLLGSLPDRIGGARVALVCVAVEAAGLAILWLAPSPGLAFLGAAVTGLGYSLVYPGFGVEAVRLTPPQTRGLSMGAYSAFLDLALGIASPILGLIASRAGLPAVFLVATLVVLSAAAVALRLGNKGKLPAPVGAPAPAPTGTDG